MSCAPYERDACAFICQPELNLEVFLCRVGGPGARLLVRNMQHIFILLIFMITATQSFMHSFLADDSAVFPVLPNASRRFQLSRIDLHPDGAEPPPPPTTWSRLNNAPVLSRITRNEVNTRRVENIMLDFFAALMNADDCTLLERQTQGMGVVYLDGNFSSSRPPRLLRAGVREIMGKYNLELRPVERRWTKSPCEENTTDMDS